MNLLAGILNGLAEIRAHKLRSLLTILCVLLGVASLVLTVGFVEGMFTSWASSLRERGGIERVTISGVEPPAWQRLSKGSSPGLTEDDAAAIIEMAPHISEVAPEIEERWTRMRAGERETTARFVGATMESFDVGRYEVARGRAFGSADFTGAEPVVILGSGPAGALFPAGEDPVGQTVYIREIPYRVIGVLRHYEALFGRFNALRWKNEIAFIPLTTFQQRVKGRRQLSSINVRVSDIDSIPEAVDAITNILTARHRGILDFEVRTSEGELASYAETRRNYMLFAAAIGTVSLLVSGIGIMNLMLASITERVREIGIRKAVGARDRDIFLQFVVESVTLSAVGGALGLAAATFLVGFLQGVLPESAQPQLSHSALATGFVFSALTGVLAGLYPAFEAAKHDPIEALRHE